MRVALVHDWLDRRIGGSERVLLEFAALYPDAPIYTLLHDPARSGDRIDPARVRPSFLQQLPAPLRRRPKYLLPLIPTAVESFDLRGFDVVLSSSAAFVKNVITPVETVHVSYCHSPMRFVWDHWPAYLDEQRVGPVRRAAIRQMVSRLRLWDFAGRGRVDAWMANSITTARRLRKYYGVDAPVVYPGIDLSEFTPASETKRADHYVTLATLTPYKRIDLAVRAFTASRRHLLVIGDGPERARLEAMAGPSVRFAGHVDDRRRLELLATARGLVFPGEEDFGIAPLEAMASGTPVIAYRLGGVAETVIEGRTGVFFDEATIESLNAAVDRLQTDPPLVGDMVSRARDFDVIRFRHGVREHVTAALAGHRERKRGLTT